MGMLSRPSPGYMCLLQLLSLFAGVSSASAQTYAFGQASLGTGTQPLSIATGDFNGDGKLDLAVVNRSDNTVSVYLGKPDGTFSLPVNYPTGPQPSSVTIGDFNADGNLDIVVTNENCTTIPKIGGLDCGSASVSVLLGNGDGTFQPHQDFATGMRPLSVKAADLNGDGKLDLVVAGDLNGSNNSVSVLLGNGDGTFQNHVDYPSPSPSGGPTWVIVGDFNGDGKPDIAADAGSGVAIYLGNGDGTLQSPTTFQLRDSNGANSGGTAGDFNGDGKLDIAVTTISGIDIFLGNGDGTFSFKAVVAGGDGPVTAVDLNKDGKLDLVVANSDGSPNANYSISALLGNGDGTFQSPISQATGMWPYAMAVGDFNGDGAIDVAVTVINNSEPFEPFQGSPVPAPGPFGSITLYLGLGNGALGFPPITPTLSTTNSLPASMKAADLNGDGKLDLVFVNSGSGGNTVSVLLGNGDGTFQSQQDFATGVLPVAVQVADLNGDGKPDLAVVDQICAIKSTSCAPGTVSVLLGNGDGTFKAHTDFGVGVTPMSLAEADFNGDGKLDLAVTNANLGLGNTISVLTGKGDGTFNPQLSYPVVNEPGPIAAADFNHDGKIDLAVGCEDLANTNACPSPLSLSILLGNGDATFQRHDFLPSSSNYPHGASSLGVGYFNGDGNPDLITGELAGGGFSVFLGNGDGTFHPGGSGSSIGIGNGLFALGDFYADGKLDVALEELTPTVAIFRGNGDGTFQSPQLLLLPNGLTFNDPVPVAGDFNNDGGLDLAVVEPGSNSLSILLNEPFKAVFPTSLSFGSQGLTTNSLVQTITVSNPTATPFTVSHISVSGAYTETDDCLTKLVPGHNCTINVTFVPVAAGVSNGALTLTDTTANSPLVIPLTGSGVSGPFLQASPARLNLASTAVGSTSAPQAITLTNTGNAMLAITNIGITGGNATDFSESNTCASGLAPGASCSVGVKFAPTASGTLVAALAIADSAPGSPQMIVLSGISVGPQPVLSPASLIFSAQIASTTSAAQSVTLTNAGNAALSITTISTSGDFAETNNCGASVAAGGTCQISVTFTPTASGSRPGMLTIADSASGSPQVVTLTGTGQDFSLAASGAASATVMPGQAATYMIALTPSGGLNPSVTLTCSGAPAMAACSISPATVTLSGTTAATATVTVTTTAGSQVFLPRGTEGLRRIGGPAMILVVCLATLLLMDWVCIAYRERRFVTMVFLACVGSTLTSCGGGSSAAGGGGGATGTEAGTYTITVTASASAGSTTLTHSTKLTLVVQ
jgi:FG-GAP-like repeat/Abnormal spindle-like microcephaly-assoc'd, ASPM-SPD-2-Hydin